MSSFDEWWKFAQKWEGAYSDDPHDPGGETKFGISRRAHPEITDEDWDDFDAVKAASIAYSAYWLPCSCDSVPSPLCIYICDTAFNQGIATAHHLAYQARDADDFLFLRIATYAKTKGAYYYLKGWINRVLDLRRTFRGA